MFATLSSLDQTAEGRKFAHITLYPRNPVQAVGFNVRHHDMSFEARVTMQNVGEFMRRSGPFACCTYNHKGERYVAETMTSRRRTPSGGARWHEVRFLGAHEALLTVVHLEGDEVDAAHEVLNGVAYDDRSAALLAFAESIR